MELKEKLKKLRDKLLENKAEQVQFDDRATTKKSECTTETVVSHFAKVRDVDLNVKVDNFIKWYSKDRYSDYVKEYKINDMKNFIEKMAVWYELRYPDYEVNLLMSSFSQNQNSTETLSAMNNKDLFDETAEYPSFEVFIKSLSAKERRYISTPKYYNLGNGDSYLKLTPTGIIQCTEGLWLNDNERQEINKEFKGKHIEELLSFVKEKAPDSDVYKSLKEVINDYNSKLYQKEEVLNCVMYRIIERGGERIGPRRAFLFAKEFERNIDIPMMYGVDYSDPGLGNFISEYIKAGGSKDLTCYIGYFPKTNKTKKLDTKSIRDLAVAMNNPSILYTPEETELHQRMVNVLSTKAGQEKVKQKK